LPLVTMLATIWTEVLLAAWEQAQPVLPVLVESIKQLVTALDLSAATPSLIETGTLLGKILADALRNLIPLIPPLVAAWVQFWSEGLLPMTPLLLRIVSELLPELLPLLAELVPLITQALGIMTVWNGGLLKLAGVFLDYVIPALKLFINDGVAPAFRNAVEIISSALALIKGVVNTVLAAIRGDWTGAFRGLQEIASAGWRLLVSGAELGIRSLIGFLGGVPGQILASFGNLGSLLLEAGKNLIRGFLRGIESMISVVRSKLRELTDLLPDWKGPPERDAKLLRANGVLIMRSLVDGFEAEEPAVRRYLTDLTDRIPAATLAVESSPVAAQRLAGQAVATASRDGASSTDLAALVDAVERLAARQVVVQVGATEIARATTEGQHALSRR
jgi:phage-related protein